MGWYCRVYPMAWYRRLSAKPREPTSFPRPLASWRSPRAQTNPFQPSQARAPLLACLARRLVWKTGNVLWTLRASAGSSRAVLNKKLRSRSLRRGIGIINCPVCRYFNPPGQTKHPIVRSAVDATSGTYNIEVTRYCMWLRIVHILEKKVWRFKGNKKNC